METWVGGWVQMGKRGCTWVLDLNKLLIQFPGSRNYGYSAKEGIFIQCVGFIHHGVIIIGQMKYRELNNIVSC